MLGGFSIVFPRWRRRSHSSRTVVDACVLDVTDGRRVYDVSDDEPFDGFVFRHHDGRRFASHAFHLHVSHRDRSEHRRHHVVFHGQHAFLVLSFHPIIRLSCRLRLSSPPTTRLLLRFVVFFYSFPRSFFFLVRCRVFLVSSSFVHIFLSLVFPSDARTCPLPCLFLPLLRRFFVMMVGLWRRTTQTCWG